MLRPAHRAGTTLRSIVAEIRGAGRASADLRSFLRWAADVLLYRALRFGDVPGANRERSIRTPAGSRVTYRLNRGDIQGLREVMMAETYRPPIDLGKVETIIDLGANIGLTSVYLANRYRPLRVIAVEPSYDNAQLVRANLAANGIEADVVEAAVGPYDGKAHFSLARDSNLGRVDADGDGQEVRMMTMASLLELLPKDATVDLLKLDIEGGEEELLRGDRAWLERVRCIMAEFHPPQVDYAGLVQILRDEGFTYIPAGSVYASSADTFLREAVLRT
jgi:FkbM family methyltransferase